MAEAVLTYVNPKSAERVLDILELVAADAGRDQPQRDHLALGLPKSSASVLAAQPRSRAPTCARAPTGGG